MKVAVSGAGGFLGSALIRTLGRRGHQTARLARSGAVAGDIAWDPVSGSIDAEALRRCDAVVHLAGESLAGGRWTRSRKERILRSRAEGTASIARSLAALRPGPSVLLVASAIGYYGDRGAERIDETASPGSGFLADVVRQWERAADPARAAGLRVVHLRFGVILARHGGALAKMLPAFRAGLGGPIGSGSQGFSFVTLDDAAEASAFLLEHRTIAGPVNVTSPRPVAQREFARALGGALGRPAVLPLPALAVRLLFGEMGREMLLSGAYVLPRRLSEAGFAFRQSTVEEALARSLTA